MSQTLTNGGSFRDQLAAVHRELRYDLPAIRRVAVAVYDQETDRLRTFLHSTDGPVPFSLHEALLTKVPSLAELGATRSDRVVADLETLRGSPSIHTRQLLERGYRSSYTRPFYEHGLLRGFVFFDSDRKDYFDAVVVRHLGVYAHLVSLLVLEALAPANVLRTAIDVTREVTHLHDAETGAHLDRMAHYAQLIAAKVATREGRDEEFVEFVLLFAPLHDIGKIAVPESILLKRDRLSESETAVMRAHVGRGLELVRSMANAFRLAQAPHMDILFNIVAHHHECYDGSGYPDGLVGREIPLEARIVAVADVFDALTTERPYKRGWSNDEAFAYLEENAGARFDAECVHALATQRPRVETIQEVFSRRLDPLGGFREAYLEDL